MMYAVANHDYDGAKQQLYAGVPADTRDVLGRTVMHSAAATGNCSVVITLLARGAEPNAVAYDGQSALHYAVSGGHLGVCELLLAAGADAQQPSWLGVTPARLAALSGEWRILQLFTESVLPKARRAAEPAVAQAKVRSKKTRAVALCAMQPPSAEAIAAAEAAAAELLATEAAEAARAAAKVAKAAKRAAEAAARKAPPPAPPPLPSSSEEDNEPEAPAPEGSWPCLPRQKPVKRVRPRRRSSASAVAPQPPQRAAATENPECATDSSAQHSEDDTCSTISEPDWLAELLEDRCDTAGERRAYVEQAVKDVAALRIELDNSKICVVCLSAEKSAVVLPCKHTGFCDGCAVALLQGPCPLCKRRIDECMLGLYCH
jgi:hypothetical protein